MSATFEQSHPAKAIWLYLLREGEFKPAGEIRCALRDVYFANFAATLLEMHRTGAISRLPGDGRRNRYGVTPTCRVVRGLTISEVLEAAAAGLAG